MSTNQLFLTKQTTKKVATKTKMAISAEQSQKLIQTMLTMSFGCLAFLRGLFPDEYFLDQRFVPEKIDKNYDKNFNKQTNSIKIKTLIKGKSKEIDLLLDWLEKGVFQSIKLKYLKALSLGIFKDENNPMDLYENYIFTFDYNDKDNNVSMSIDTQDLSSSPSGRKQHSNNDVISIQDSRKMVQQLMRRFIIITQSLEPLPDEKFLSMRLLFNDNVDPNYQPLLFKDATFEPRATIKISRNLENDSFDVGKLNTGYHRCQLAVLSSCQNVNKSQNNNGNDYNGEVGEEEDIEIDDYQEVDPLQRIIDMDLSEKENKPILSSIIPNEPEFIPKNGKMQQSQTANILGEFLNSSQPSILPTQMETTINKPPKNKNNNNNSSNSEQHEQSNCECNTSLNGTVGTTKSCFKCNRLVHSLCYGNSSNSKIECFTCVYESEDTQNRLITNNSTFHKFMILRKTYRAINKLFGDPPESLTQYMARVFTPDECKISKNIEDFIFALNCLFYDNTFRLASENEIVSRYNISCEILVNIPGIRTREQIPLALGKKYQITIQIGNRTGNLSYLKVLPKSKEEINQWVNDFERLQAILTKDPKKFSGISKEDEIISLSSLVINDTETQDPIQIGKKRKGLDLDYYLDTNESSMIPDTFAINKEGSIKEDGYKPKGKARKISISKRIVKSAW